MLNVSPKLLLATTVMAMAMITLVTLHQSPVKLPSESNELIKEQKDLLQLQNLLKTIGNIENNNEILPKFSKDENNGSIGQKGIGLDSNRRDFDNLINQQSSEITEKLFKAHKELDRTNGNYDLYQEKLNDSNVAIPSINQDFEDNDKTDNNSILHKNRILNKQRKKSMKKLRKSKLQKSNSDPNAFDPEQRGDLNDPERLRRHKISPIKDLPRDKWWPVILEPSYGKIYRELDLINYTKEDQEYLKDRIPEYERRANSVSKTCSANAHLMKRKVNLKTLVWDTRHLMTVVWCQIPKIASSSWNANFYKMGLPDPTAALAHDPVLEDEDSLNLHHEVFRMYPAPNSSLERNEVFRSALRFIIVRHPFVRLVSAFRDKIAKDDPKPVWFHYELLQKHIIETYRPSNSSIVDRFPTFPEFASYVIDQTTGMRTRQDWKNVQCWKPYHVTCGVCVQDFQLILKLETLEEDTEFLATLAGLTELKKIHTWRHQIDGLSSSGLSLKMFEQLSKAQVNKLYSRYKVDFDLFEYTPQEYIDRAGPEAVNNND